MSDTNREQLLKTANLIRPALATQPYIPALTHIRFDGKRATAYNDIAAIQVECDLDAQRLIPGEMLIKSLSSFNGENVTLQEDKDGAIVIKSGRAKMKLPTLGLEKFPLELPEATSKTPEVELTENLLKGIQRCLISVGNDPTHPAQMGVTLDIDGDGCAILFSTDNFTISRYETADKIKLPGDAPVILPTFFCEQVLKLAGAYPKAEAVMTIHDGALMAEFGKDALVFTKTLVDLTPMEFPRIIGKHCDVHELGDQLINIPDGFDEALDRALLVLASEADRSTLIDQSDSSFTMTTESEAGRADDRFKFEHDDTSPFYIDPSYLSRAARVCTKMVFSPRVLVMSDGEAFTHLIAHNAKPAK